MSEQEYRSALRELARIIDIEPAPGTPEFLRAQVLSEILYSYEEYDV